VVDDGLATGSTMIAALRALRQRNPKELICAVPVAPPDTLDKVGHYADQVVCLHASAEFFAVSQFYGHFPQVDDEEVMSILHQTGGSN
ncbi:MAG: phosphoribosyltransferase family protein, partial [Burkholderiales bacterium]